MVEAVFSLQGRLKRLPYFLGSVTLALTFFAGLVAIVMGGASAAQGRNWDALAVFVVCLVPLVAALLWCSLALHVRRIRDIGWDPALVIAGWLLFKLADHLVLAALLPKLAAHDRWHGTFIDGALDFALSLAILLLPSHGAPDVDYTQPGPPRWPEPARPAARVVSPRRTVGGTPVFGRRA